MVAMLQRFFDIAELLVHFGTKIAGVLRVQLRSARGQGFFDGKHGRQLLVLHSDQRHRLFGGVAVDGGHGCNFVADIAHAVLSKHRFVIASRTYAVFNGPGFLSGYHRFDAGELFGASGVDIHDPRMRQGTLQQGGMQHTGQVHVVDKGGPSGGFVGRIQPGQAAVDHIEGSHASSSVRAPDTGREGEAERIASKIFW